MADYEPLDISQWCNAGVSELGDGAEVPVGRQTMRGLPFLVGSDGAGSTGNVYIALDGSQEPLSVPIGRPARRVVLAHRMLETKVGDGGPTGTQVAEYVFRLAGGRVERVPIRERFRNRRHEDRLGCRQGHGAPNRASLHGGLRPGGTALSTARGTVEPDR